MISIQKSTLLVLCLFVAAQAHAGWYGGASIGATRLTPDTENSGFTLDSDTSIGGGVFAGYDISDRISGEIAYHALGNAGLTNNNGTTDIGYAALSAGAVFYLLGDARDISERDGRIGYLRLGINSMDNQHSIPVEKTNNMGVWAGIGMEWPISRNISMRGELTSFDGDAQAALMSLLYRPKALNNGNYRAKLPEPVAAPTPKPVIETPPVATTPEIVSAPLPVPEAVPAPPVKQMPQITRPSGGLLIQQPMVKPVVPSKPAIAITADCGVPFANEPADTRGCALFSGAVAGVKFESVSDRLTLAGERALVQLATQLLQHPTVVVEIAAHTEQLASAEQAKTLARKRAIAVARALAGNGVPVKRLRARAYGSAVPVADNATAIGRQSNNRIELKVIR